MLCCRLKIQESWIRMQEICLTSGKNNLLMPDRAITLMVDKDTFFNLKFTCIYWTLNWLIYWWTVEKHKWHDRVMGRYHSDRQAKWKQNYMTFFYWTCALSFFLQLSQCFIAFRVRYLIHGLKNVSLPWQGGCHLVALKVSNRDLKISTLPMHTISQQAVPGAFISKHDFPPRMLGSRGGLQKS